MDRLISEKSVMEVIYGCDWFIDEEHAEVIKERIKSISSAKPKTGHWIETAEEYYKAVNEYGGGVNEDTPYFVDDIACSVCLAKYSVIDNETERFDCCPSCGVKLVEPQKSEKIETWNGIRAQITAPKGTFERIFNDADDDNDI